MPLQATSGAASYDAFGGGVPVVPNYIEDVFSTYLYTPTTSNTAINIPNGIDLSTKGGMVWFKKRTGYADSHSLVDTVRGGTSLLTPNDTYAAYTANIISSFNTNGFTTGISSFVSIADANFVSWTFRKQPKFFDVVTWTGNGGGSRAISHALASTVGCIMIKRTDSSDNWYVVHRSAASGFSQYGTLNTTNAFVNGSDVSSVGSSTFTVSNYYNTTGETWVAYLFAHNAGGFGLTGTDNVISCGSYTTDASAAGSATLGFEPQWLLAKTATGTGEWYIVDNMRGFGMTQAPILRPNSSGAEDVSGFGGSLIPTATGFIDKGTIAVNATIIYIAIRRGPMKVPTSGASVLNITTSAGTSPAYVSSFPVDFAYRKQITSTSSNYFHTRLQGAKTLYTNSTAAEDDDSNVTWAYQNGMFTTTGANADQYGWLMRRAPSFFDVVCYTGTGTAGQTFNHNLGVAPELMIVKRRSDTRDWIVYAAPLGATKALFLNTYDAVQTETYWNDTAPTSSVFSVGDYPAVNFSASTYVAYLFATCAGVSKIGNYTGTGTTLQIDCGFTAGARFVLIKRTNSTGGGTGDWYVWDSARGIVSGNDPYLLLNSTAAEVINTDYVDTYSAGFEISSTAPVAINASGGAYIFLAIA